MSRNLTTVGTWVTGCGLAFAATIRMFDIPWETYVALRDIGLVIAGAGVAALLYGFASRLGVGGWGAGLCALALGGALIDGLSDTPDIWPIILLCLLSVGVPMLVRKVADRTRMVAAAGQFGAVALGALGVSLTAEITSGALGDLSEQMYRTVDGALNVAMVLSLLAAAMATGMAIASRVGDHPSPATVPAASSSPDSPGGPGEAEVAQLPAAAATSQPMSNYQRLTLLVALAGTVVSALISVLGSVLAAVVTGDGS